MTRFLKHNRLTSTAIMLFLSVCLMASSSARADTEAARVDTDPWSGYWWPISRGELLVPLAKYDSLVGSRAAAWEQANNPPGENVPKWFGYCHAWAASSIMEKEPSEAIRVRSQPLGVGDQKGLLAACHANDVTNSFGDRFGDGRGSEDRNDLPPDEFWMLLKRHISEQGVPLIVDIEAGDEVWNYPIFAYRVEYAATASEANRYRGTISIWMADDAVPMDYVGIKRLFKKYRFEVTLRNGSVVMGSGQWLGTSQQNHPDFAWFPYVVRPENPEVDRGKVTQILGAEAASGNAPSDDETRPSDETPSGGTPSGSTPSGGIPSDETPSGETPSDSQPSSQPSGVVVETRPEPLLLDPMDVVSLIATRTSDFSLDITVDRFDGGKYREGDLVSIAGKSAEDGYLYLLAIDTEGVPSLLYPQPGDDNRVQGGVEFDIPTRTAGYQFRLLPPYGDYRIKGIVCEKTLEFSGLVIGDQAQVVPTQYADNAKETQKADVAIDRQKFRWNPTQREQVKFLLTEYTTMGNLSQEQVDHVDPRDILGAFAQDEVAFYVGKKGNESPNQTQTERR